MPSTKSSVTPSAAPPESLLPWILDSLRPYSGRIALLTMLSCLEVTFRVVSPWALRVVVDQVFSAQPVSPWLQGLTASTGATLGLDRVRALLIVVVLLGLLAQLAHQLVLMLHTRLFAITGQWMLRDLRERLFAHLQGLALLHHVRTPTGDAVYRLEADASCLEHLVLRGMFPLVFSVVTLAVMFVILWRIDYILALVSLAVVPGLSLSLRRHTRRIGPEAERVKALESQAMARAYESFATIRLVKSFARETHERQRFAGVTSAAMQARASN